MTGLVLSGGKSSRMGADKGLLIKDGKTWAEIAREKLSLTFPRVVISVNKEQYIKYSELLSQDILVEDNSLLTVKGPLLGILSCHNQFPQSDLFVLACDLLFMDSKLIEMLFNSYRQHPGYDAYLFKYHDDLEPLCSIYSSKALKYINEMHQKSPNAENSMKYMLSQLKALSIELNDESRKLFTNFNEPDALKNL